MSTLATVYRGACVTALLTGLAACAAAARGNEDGGGADPCTADVLSLDIVPQTFARGADVELTLTWTTSWAIYDPTTVTLAAGVEAEGDPGAVRIEVEVPLVRTTSDADDPEAAVYAGAVTNPFGAGAPAGGGSVLATSGTRDDSCPIPVSATTSFVLQ